MLETDQEDISDDLLISQNKYMICSICEKHLSWNRDGDEDFMEEHYQEKHGYIKC